MTDTIAAVATGAAVSAIGIVRVSGDDAIFAANKVFFPSGGSRLVDVKSRHMQYGKLVDADGVLIDLCLCVVSRKPDSYTGEDTVEFHCHGSPVVLAEALRALFSNGVRQADAGEFTKRAFLNGRMDLTQAEAVIDLIEAESSASAHNAAAQLQGAISVRLESIYSGLMDVVAHFHAIIDYPDEDIDEFSFMNYLPMLISCESELLRLLSTYERGRILRDGVPTAIVGRPNTGKSSLLNALLGFQRAIVTDIPGTTRDTIEEKAMVGGILLRLIDTAGIREATDSIEQLGVARALDALSGAGCVFLVLDGSMPFQDEDFEALRAIPTGIPVLVVVNKSDLPCLIDDDTLSSLGLVFCRVSSLSGDGLEALAWSVKSAFPSLALPSDGGIITNARQADAISRASCFIRGAIDAIESSFTPDAVLTDVEGALSMVGELTGKVMREDIILRIFERFCVGK